MTVAHVYGITFKQRICTVTIKQDKIIHNLKRERTMKFRLLKSYLELAIHNRDDAFLAAWHLMSHGLSFTAYRWLRQGSDLCGSCGKKGHTEPSLVVSRDRNNNEWSLYDWLYAKLCNMCFLTFSQVWKGNWQTIQNFVTNNGFEYRINYRYTPRPCFSELC